MFVCFSLIQFYTNFLNSSDSSDGVMSIENTASRVPLDYIFICRVVDHVVRWGGKVICLFLFFLFFLKCSSTALNLLSPKVHYSDIQLLNDKCTDRQRAVDGDEKSLL